MGHALFKCEMRQAEPHNIHYHYTLCFHSSLPNPDKAVLCRSGMHRGTLEGIMGRCGKSETLCILDTSDCAAEDFLFCFSTARRPDVVVTGENLTAHQVPFGAFSMAPHVYRAWNTFDDCFIHTSTFGGNSLAVGTVVKTLLGMLEGAGDKAEIDRAAAEIDESQRATVRYYARHVNPKGVILFASVGADRRYLSARGTGFTLRTTRGERVIFDALGSYGSCMRGHNPPDVEEVVDHHDPARDYWRELEGELKVQTGLPRALPAVSGATAVESALIVSLCAQAPRKKIVVFDKGFAGKTLSALIGTSKKHYREPFAPLYRYTEYVDPFDGAGVRRIEELCRSKEVALFWFEPVQGEGGVRRIPEEVFSLLREHRAGGGYLVALDEIQTGMFRTGTVLCSTAFIEADVVTLAKGLADMTFPVGATMVSEEVYQRARSGFPEAVRHLETYYLNQLGAHVALHGLRKAVESGLGDRAAEMGKVLTKELGRLRPLSSMIRDTRGTGLLQAVEFNSRLWGLRLPVVDEYFGAIFGGLCARNPDMPLLTAYTLNNPSIVRIAPPLTVTEEEIKRLVLTIEDTLKGGWPGLLASTVAHNIRRFLHPGGWLR